MPRPLRERIHAYWHCLTCGQDYVVCREATGIEVELAIHTCAWPPEKGWRLALNGDNTTFRAYPAPGGYARHTCKE